MALSFDPGLTQRYTGDVRRIINKDGSFNVRRTGGQKHLYLQLISMNWRKFWLVAFCSFLGMNLLFASVYVMLGRENLLGGDPEMTPFANAFFFSTQTLTTVGYGHISPRGYATSLTAALEGMFGLMGFAVITGLLYGRISRPSARVVFSRQLVVSPYEGGASLQFRLANSRPNILMDLEAVVLLMTVEKDDQGQLRRKYAELTLERSHVYFFPLTWTVVHPVTATSPLFGKRHEDLVALQAELLILIRSFDDTFSQNVHARHSYRHEEIVWNARFQPAFYFDDRGDMVLELEKLDAIEKLTEPLPVVSPGFAPVTGQRPAC